MIRNYLLTAWRNLIKNKLNAIINIAGLAVAFTCSILLFLAVHHEFSFDGFHTNKDRLFEVYGNSYSSVDGKTASMSFPIVPAMKAELPGVVGATAFMNDGVGIRYKTKEVAKGVTLVDDDFFHMFSFPIVAGNKSSPLASPGNVVISESTARAVFGSESPIDKIVAVKISGQWKDLRVTAIIADYPRNSSLGYNILARIELQGGYPEQKNKWDYTHHAVYVQLSPSVTQAQVEKGLRDLVKKYHAADQDYFKQKGFHKDANGDYYALRLAPFNSLHFDNELGSGRVVSKPYLYTLILITVIVLTIACFNFINLNVARSFTRAKEVGIRKTIGADKGQIFFQLWTESLVLCMIAVAVAALASTALLHPFNDLFGERLTMDQLMRPSVVTSIIGGLLLMSFLAGGYPALLVSRFQAVEVLKGKVAVGRSSLLRNGLITLQFVMASLLICGTIVIYRQFQHLRNAPLGYEQESVISIPVKNREVGIRYIGELRNTLRSQPQVVSVTGSSVNLGIGEDGSTNNWSMSFNYGEKSIETAVVYVDYDYLQTLGIRTLQGRTFSMDFPSDTSHAMNNVVVSESMARQFGVKDPIGLSFYAADSSSPKWNIIGIIPDMHLYSMNNKIYPLTLQMRKDGRMDYILVKVRTDNPGQAMRLVQAAYKTVEPDNDVAASWVTENTRRWYDKESKLSQIFFTAAGIAILLSCLGLFAIVFLVMQQRRKEIGVRKVLGASLPQLAKLLSRDFIRLVVLAFVLATPIAWYFLHLWLENFVYRIDIDWWMFPVAGVLTLVIALLTIGIQTVSAALANPVDSLRSE